VPQRKSLAIDPAQSVWSATTCHLSDFAPIEAAGAGRVKSIEPGSVFAANTRALASIASVFREVVYDFRELASVAHALRTSTRRIVEHIMRATGGLNIAHL
jgi:hypothetical protein